MPSPLETKRRPLPTQCLAFAVVATLMAGTPVVRAQGLLDTIRTPDKSVPVVNQAVRHLVTGTAPSRASSGHWDAQSRHISTGRHDRLDRLGW